MLNETFQNLVKKILTFSTNFCVTYGHHVALNRDSFAATCQSLAAIPRAGLGTIWSIISLLAASLLAAMAIPFADLGNSASLCTLPSSIILLNVALAALP